MTAFELERAVDREELAALFETLAAAARGDRSARIDGDDGTLAIAFPERTGLGLELEREGEEATTVELELELEWDDPAGDPSVRVYGSESEARAETAAGDEAQTTLPDGEEGGERGDGEEGGDRPEPDGSDGVDRPPRRSRFEVYRDRGDEWRWRLVHWNGNVVADSGEGYASRYNAVRALRSVMRIAPEARVERLDP